MKVAYFLIFAVFVISGIQLLSTGVSGGVSRPVESFKQADIFKENCASCHGKDGRAKSLRGKLVKARDLTDVAWHESVSDARIRNSIADGYGKKMPAWKEKLTAAQIDSLVNFIRGLRK